MLSYPKTKFREGGGTSKLVQGDNRFFSMNLFMRAVFPQRGSRTNASVRARQSPCLSQHSCKIDFRGKASQIIDAGRIICYNKNIDTMYLPSICDMLKRSACVQYWFVYLYKPKKYPGIIREFSRVHGSVICRAETRI